MKILVAATAEYYRRLAQEKVSIGSTVIEVGCSTGITTRILAGRCARVVAVDVSEEMVARVRTDFADCPNVWVERVDGRDTGRLSELADAPDAIFIDIGGIEGLENVITVVWQCLHCLPPQGLLVVRSEKLAQLMRMVSVVEPKAFHEPGSSRRQRAPLESLLELSHSPQVGNRIFAARRLRAQGSPQAQQRLEEMRSDLSSKVRHIAQLPMGTENT